MSFGERLKQLRKNKKMTQDDLAASSGVTKSAVSAWENNQRRPSFEILDSLCTLFEVDLAYLLGQSETNHFSPMSNERIDLLAEWDEIEEYEDIFRRFAVLDSYGQAAVDAVLRAEFKRCMETGTLQQGRTINVSIKEKKASASDASE